MSRMSLTDQLNSHLDHGGTLTDLLNSQLAASEGTSHDTGEQGGPEAPAYAPAAPPVATESTLQATEGATHDYGEAFSPNRDRRFDIHGAGLSHEPGPDEIDAIQAFQAEQERRRADTTAYMGHGPKAFRGIVGASPAVTGIPLRRLQGPTTRAEEVQNAMESAGEKGMAQRASAGAQGAGFVPAVREIAGQAAGEGLIQTAAGWTNAAGGDVNPEGDTAASRALGLTQEDRAAMAEQSQAMADKHPVAAFVGNLNAMPATLLEPKTLAAMILTHAPAGSLMGSVPVRAMFQAVADKLGPVAARAVEAEVKGSVGVGAFTGTQKAIEGGNLGEVTQAAGTGMKQGAILAAPFAGVAAAGVPLEAAAKAREAADVQTRGDAIRGASDQYRQAQEAGKTQTPDFARQTPEQQAANQGAADELLKPPPSKAPEVTPEQQAAFLKAQDVAKAEFRKQAGLPPEEASAPTPAPPPPAPPVNLVEEAKRLRTDPTLTDEERADALQKLFRDARVREAQGRLRDAEKPQPKQVLTDRPPTPEEVTAAGDSGLENLLNRPQTPPETPDAGGVQGSLIARGRYQQQTRRALIVEARGRELSAAGTKDDLVQRLMDDDQQQQEANDAAGVRTDTGRPGEAGQAAGGSENDGGKNLEQPPPQQPSNEPAGSAPGPGEAPPTPTAPPLAGMTRPQLIKEARRRGVPAGGTAEELRTRLQSSDEAATPKDEQTEAEGAATGRVEGEGKPVSGVRQPDEVRAASQGATGIAHDVAEARGTAAERGEGITPEESAARGRELIDKHLAKPEKVVGDFEKSGKISGDDMAVVGEHARQLQMARDLAESTKGKDSPEFKQAFDDETAWIKRIKPMQTEWHKSGQAQQAVRSEVDTSTFGGLRRAFVDAHDKDLTPAQERVADATAKRVREATKATDEARAKLAEAAGIAETEAEGAKSEPAKPAKASRPSTRKVTDQVLSKIQSAADAARERIKARGTRLMSGVDPFDIADHVIVGASHIAKGIVKFADWSTQMLADFGDGIKPRLKEIYNASVDRFNSEAKGSPGFSDHKPGSKMSPENVKALWKNAKGYIEKGMGFDDVVHKLAADHGLPVNDIRRGLAQPKGARALTDDMYRKQSAQRRVIQDAKLWVQEAGKPGWQRAAEKIPRAFFTAKVFGHGTVGMITHAGNQMLDPRVADHYWTNFARQFKLMGVHDAGAFHEQAMADLERRPNYITARRAGLANDPGRATDDYQQTAVAKWLGKYGLVGNRGFDALKIFRQDLFDHQWDTLPESLKTKEMAQVIAADANHVTGTVKANVGGNVASTIFFAPKLEASRWATLIGDPAKAAKTLAVKLSGGEVTPHDWYQAVAQFKQKTIMAATLFSALAVNQGLLKVTGSSQSINFSDPSKSDFLAFKAAGYKVSPISPLVGAFRFLHNIATASGGDYDPRATREERMTKIGEQYARGKLSPLAGFVADNAFQNTFKDGTSVPVAWSSDPLSPRAAAKGIGKETPLEMAGKAGLPIPLEAAINEALRGDGANDATAKKIVRAVTVMGITGGTGAHISADKPPTTPPTPDAIKWSGFNARLDQIRAAARSLDVSKRAAFIQSQAATMSQDEQARLRQQVSQHQASWMSP